MTTGTAAVQPRLTVPFVIAYSGEIVSDPIHFVAMYGSPGSLRLSYVQPVLGDWSFGTLQARARVDRQGSPLWRMLNPRRQWACMVNLLCQVCGQPARTRDGRVPWIMTETAFHRDGEEPDTAITNAPPTCWTCIPGALAMCPQLRISSTVCTAGYAAPIGILGDVYAPLPNGEVFPTEQRNVEVRFTDKQLLRNVLAHQLIVRVCDLNPVTTLEERAA